MAGTDRVVAEAFVRRAVLGIIAEQRRKRRHDRVAADITAVQLVHARAIERAAEIQVV